jgi:hypothetical protein
MHIVVIAWLYVALMMALAEATSTTGTVLGAVFTFVLYGAAPVALVVYLMNAPTRRKKLKARELAAQAAARSASGSPAASAASAASAALAVPVGVDPDAGGKAPADAVAAVRKET